MFVLKTRPSVVLFFDERSRFFYSLLVCTGHSPISGASTTLHVFSCLAMRLTLFDTFSLLLSLPEKYADYLIFI